MATQPPAQRPLGYPALHRVQRGCRYVAQAEPDDAYMMCIAQLHNLSKTTTAALLQVFKNTTLAACWMLRDIEQRNPEQRFAAFRKTNSTRYFTDGIAETIEKHYRATITSRYAINTYLYGGIAATLASMISGYLQKVAEAHKRGFFAQFQQSADFVVPVGKYRGETLGTLGRRTIFGYAFLVPTREQCQEALTQLHVLLERYNDDPTITNTANTYRMRFGSRRNKPLGTARGETLKRLKAVTERYLAEMDAYDMLRVQAQQYLRFTPPGFPRLKSDGLSVGRRQQLQTDHVQALDAFGALPEWDEDLLDRDLTTEERTLFQQLQQQAYADTRAPKYMPLRWNRADAPTRHRECGVVYDPKKKRYLFLAYVLARSSRHRRPLTTNHQLFDVNNPTTPLTTSKRPTSARLFELEFATHQQHMLDQAREDAGRWKSLKSMSSGCVRAATLHAQYAPNRQHWWFEVHLSIGIKPTHITEPQHIMGVHVDPICGWYIAIAAFNGTITQHFALDEMSIARLLNNKHPAAQAQLPVDQRPAKERQHRVADALVALCQQHQAQLGIENISYRTRQATPGADRAKKLSIQTIAALLPYKLARLNLPPLIEMKGVAPKRDCGACGVRHGCSQVQAGRFVCSACGVEQDRYLNTAREIARRVLWRLAHKQAPAP